MSADREKVASVTDVVLVHGWGTHAGVWNELASILAADFQVHAVDLPGYRNRPPCQPGSLLALARALATTVPRACHVVGWSLGALLALAWAHATPGQVRRLALISATPCFARRDDWAHGAETRLLHEFDEQLANDHEGTMGRFIALQGLDDGDARRTTRELRRHVVARDQASIETLQGGLRILLDADLRAELGCIRQPTLVLHGDRDRLIPLSAGRYLGRRIPGARFTAVAGAGHAPFISQPLLVGRLLREFFDE